MNFVVNDKMTIGELWNSITYLIFKMSLGMTPHPLNASVITTHCVQKSICDSTLKQVAYLESLLVFSIEPFIQKPYSKPSYTLIITYLHLFRNYSSLIGHIRNLIWSWHIQNIDKFGTPPYLEPEIY